MTAPKQYNFDVLDKTEKCNLLRMAPLRVLDTLPELEYAFIPADERTMADKIDFYQGVVSSLRIHDYGERTQKLFQILYKQGILFDHTRAALDDGDINPHGDPRSWREIADTPPRGAKKKQLDPSDIEFYNQWLIPDKPEWMKRKEKKEKKK
jgi:hypothetical protein